MESNKNDIYISDTNRISWIDVDSFGDNIIDIDSWISAHEDFWRGIETNCVAACCGLDAFSFYAEDITNAASYIDKGKLLNDLSRLKCDLISVDGTVVTSSRLNSTLHKQVFLQLIDHIISAL